MPRYTTSSADSFAAFSATSTVTPRCNRLAAPTWTPWQLVRHRTLGKTWVPYQSEETPVLTVIAHFFQSLAVGPCAGSSEDLLRPGPPVGLLVVPEARDLQRAFQQGRTPDQAIPRLG